jgi:sialidase-1
MHNQQFILLSVVVALLALGPNRATSSDMPEQKPLFTASDDGYHTFRIPALIVTRAGTVLAFCEGRKASRSDHGDIDLVMRRSTDGGRTWSEAVVIAEDGTNTVGNPCPVVDRKTGRIWLPLTWNLGTDSEKQILAGTSQRSREVWIIHSDDDGVTWSEPKNITADVKPADWRWYATGPGCGIQLASGRLVIPCDHILAGPVHRSHVIYSDDSGISWQLGGVVGDGYNECQVAERADGSLLLNMRSYKKQNLRGIAVSEDAGKTWSAPVEDAALVEPVCQASLIALDAPSKDSKRRILFANPASTQREQMTVRLSHDDGDTWPHQRLLHAGPSAYSALAQLPSGEILCLYERGEKGPYEMLTLARFNLDWITGD